MVEKPWGGPFFDLGGKERLKKLKKQAIFFPAFAKGGPQSLLKAARHQRFTNVSIPPEKSQFNKNTIRNRNWD